MMKTQLSVVMVVSKASITKCPVTSYCIYASGHQLIFMNGHPSFKFSTFGPYLGSREYISYLPQKPVLTSILK